MNINIFSYEGKKVSTLNQFNSLEEIIEKQNDIDFICSEELENLKVDEKYYMIDDDLNLIGVIALNKGWTFIDCMEHDERIIAVEIIKKVYGKISKEKYDSYYL